jgi:hypothetical protein
VLLINLFFLFFLQLELNLFLSISNLCLSEAKNQFLFCRCEPILQFETDHLFVNLVMTYLECLYLNLFLEVDLRPMAVLFVQF